LSDETIEQFERALQDAKQENRTEFAPAGFPKPIRVAEAEALVATFKKSKRDLAARAFDAEQATGRPPVSRLIVKRNDETVNYAEPGGDLTPPVENKPLLPRTLKAQRHFIATSTERYCLVAAFVASLAGGLSRSAARR